MRNADYEPNDPPYECEVCHWGLHKDDAWWSDDGYGPLCEEHFMERMERMVPEEVEA